MSKKQYCLRLTFRTVGDAEHVREMALKATTGSPEFGSENSKLRETLALGQLTLPDTEQGFDVSDLEQHKRGCGFYLSPVEYGGRRILKTCSVGDVMAYGDFDGVELNDISLSVL